MKASVALFVSAASAASLQARVIREGLPLSSFPKVPTMSPEDAAAGKDILDIDLDLGKGIHIDLTIGQGLDHFGEVHTVTPEEAALGMDLGGNNFTNLPISKLGEEARDVGDCANPAIRFEWDNYSASDKQAFVDAIQCLVNKPASGRFPPARNRYEDFVRLHQNYAPNIHSINTQQQTHKFLLWHRYYIWAFEQVLRDECGFNRAFTWWDEKKWAGQFRSATIFTNQYFGSLPGPTNNAGTCITNGRFAGMTCSLGPGSAGNNPHCLQRAVNEATTANTGQNAWNTCFSRTSYPDFHSCVEFSFHGAGHNGIGAIMGDAIASPSDPVFWMHHTFIDYALRKWQNEAESRRNSISGCATNQGCPPLTLDTMIYMGQICGAKCPDLPVRDLLSTVKGKLCYRYDY